MDGFAIAATQNKARKSKATKREAHPPSPFHFDLVKILFFLFLSISFLL